MASVSWPSAWWKNEQEPGFKRPEGAVMKRDTAVTFYEQLTELDREIKMRELLYPRWVTEDRMNIADAQKQLARLKAVRETMLALKQYHHAVPQAFFSLRTITVDV
jgi:hypothetical protein